MHENDDHSARIQRAAQLHAQHLRAANGNDAEACASLEVAAEVALVDTLASLLGAARVCREARRACPRELVQSVEDSVAVVAEARDEAEDARAFLSVDGDANRAALALAGAEAWRIAALTMRAEADELAVHMRRVVREREDEGEVAARDAL